MTRDARPSLKRSIIGVVLVLALLATVVAGAFAYPTAALHVSGEAIESSTESVKLVEETQRDLLLHELAADFETFAQLAAAVRSGLAEARRYVGSEEEARSLEAAQKASVVRLPASPAGAGG